MQCKRSVFGYFLWCVERGGKNRGGKDIVPVVEVSKCRASSDEVVHGARLIRHDKMESALRATGLPRTYWVVGDVLLASIAIQIGHMVPSGGV